MIAHGIGADGGIGIHLSRSNGVTGPDDRRGAAIVAAAHRRDHPGAICVGLLLSFPLIGRLSGMDVTARRSCRRRSLAAACLVPRAGAVVARWRGAGGYVVAAQTGSWRRRSPRRDRARLLRVLFRSAERLAGVAGAGRRPSPPGRARRAPPRVRASNTGDHRFHSHRTEPKPAASIRVHARAGGGVALLIGQIATAMEGVTPSHRGRAPRSSGVGAPCWSR